jgi:hypothetical protein
VSDAFSSRLQSLTLSKIHLFYLDNKCMLCERVYDAQHNNWNAGQLNSLKLQPSNRSRLAAGLCEKSGIMSSAIFVFYEKQLTGELVEVVREQLSNWRVVQRPISDKCKPIVITGGDLFTYGPFRNCRYKTCDECERVCVYYEDPNHQVKESSFKLHWSESLDGTGSSWANEKVAPWRTQIVPAIFCRKDRKDLPGSLEEMKDCKVPERTAFLHDNPHYHGEGAPPYVFFQSDENQISFRQPRLGKQWILWQDFESVGKTKENTRICATFMPDRRANGESILRPAVIFITEAGTMSLVALDFDQTPPIYKEMALFGPCCEKRKLKDLM